MKIVILNKLTKTERVLGDTGLDGLRKITRIDNLEDYLPITGVTLNASQTFPVLVLAPELY